MVYSFSLTIFFDRNKAKEDFRTPYALRTQVFKARSVWRRLSSRIFYEILLLFFIRGYQWTVGTLIGKSCRFYPSCSDYGAEAVKKHGACKGGWLVVKRIAKCHPWHPGGWTKCLSYFFSWGISSFLPGRRRSVSRWFAFMSASMDTRYSRDLPKGIPFLNRMQFLSIGWGRGWGVMARGSSGFCSGKTLRRARV